MIYGIPMLVADIHSWQLRASRGAGTIHETTSRQWLHGLGIVVERAVCFNVGVTQLRVGRWAGTPAALPPPIVDPR